MSKAASNVRDERSAIAATSSAYDRNASHMSSRWRGQAGPEFRDMARRKQRQANDVNRAYSGLSSALLRLSSSANRAKSEEIRGRM